MHNAHPHMINNNIIMQLKGKRKCWRWIESVSVSFTLSHNSWIMPSAKQIHQNDIIRITWERISWSRQPKCVVKFSFIKKAQKPAPMHVVVKLIIIHFCMFVRSSREWFAEQENDLFANFSFWLRTLLLFFCAANLHRDYFSVLGAFKQYIALNKVKNKRKKKIM